MKIAFIYNSNSYFTRLDLEILREQHEIVPLFFDKKIEALRIWKYFGVLKGCDVYICWFASWHTIIPLLVAKLLRKPFILIGGGYDSANVPEAAYGNQRIWWKRILSNYSFRSADKLVVNSNFIKQEIKTLGGVSEERMEVIYHGIPELAEKTNLNQKENIALNVGNLSKQNTLRKGIKPFIQAAGLLPEWRFIQAGKWKDDAHQELNQIKASNAYLEGLVSDTRLRELFQKASVYIQPSLHEGFGLSVIEAMQYGCIPVVSKHGALPEVVGGFGVILEDLEPETIVQGINLAIQEFHDRRQLIQDYVHQNFSLVQRSEKMLNVLKAYEK